MSVGPIVNAPVTPSWTTEDRSNQPATNAPAQQALPQAPQPPTAPKVPKDVQDLADELNRERERLKTMAGRPRPEINEQIKLVESLYGKLSDAQDRHIKTGDWHAPDLPRKVQDLKHLQDQVSELLSKSAASSGPLSGETLGLQMFKKLIDGKMTEALERTGKWPPHIVPATPAPEPEFLVRLRKRLDADISALDKNRQVMSSPDIAKAQNQILAQRTTLEAEALKFQTNDHARCALEEKRQYDAQYAEAYRLACGQQ